jgi:hypothetical protein
MVIIVKDDGYSIEEITKEDLASLQRIISSSQLPDKRNWYNVNKQIAQINP